MLYNHKISIVIPCFNEELLIKKTVLSLPDFIDCIIVIDDKSTDKTPIILKELSKKIKKLVILTHEVNKGVGASISSGYKYSLKNKFNYTFVVGADSQMNPLELKPMLKYISLNKFDYVKGNRFLKPWTIIKMPLVRIFGSLSLNILTKIATGLYHIGDPQSGYTVISLNALEKLDLDNVYPRYGYPNDLLGKLAIIGAKVRDFPISAIYEDEKSGLKPIKIIIPYSKLLFKIYKQRVFKK